MLDTLTCNTKPFTHRAKVRYGLQMPNKEFSYKLYNNKVIVLLSYQQAQRLHKLG